MKILKHGTVKITFKGHVDGSVEIDGFDMQREGDEIFADVAVTALLEAKRVIVIKLAQLGAIDRSDSIKLFDIPGNAIHIQEFNSENPSATQFTLG